MSNKKVKITQVKSGICAKEPHKRTLKALGLRHPNHSVEKELNPAVKGMVDAVAYLVKVEELN